jgi:2-methylisocitrate lyase-like PEP mutase family enzyme
MTAARLRALHRAGSPLILPNVWDAASARAVEAAGFPAVATSSGAVAESLGYSDHEGAPAGEMFDAVRRITRVAGVPVTVDAESGYGLSARELAGRLGESGAAGCNIEDTDHTGGGLVDVAAQAAKLATLREAAGGELVINARIDVFLGVEDQHAVLDAAIERAHAYLDAGVDCVFPILIRSREVLAAFTEAVSPAAVNATYLAGGPTLPELAELGVARISLGLGLWRHAQSHLDAAVTALASGTAPY